MTDLRSIAHSIQEPTQVGEARRGAALLGAQAGLDEQAAGRLAIIVTELANNLYKHAREGAIVLRALHSGPPSIEVLAVDKGPGMEDLGKCFQDGYSTGGTPGTGLGSIARLADFHDVYSAPGGTVVLAHVAGKVPGLPNCVTPNPRVEVGPVTLPFKGETRCGDNWSHLSLADCERLFVADGLGHGPEAAEASDEARRIFESGAGRPLPELMDYLHRSLKRTRGAAVAIAEIDLRAGVVRYVGAGNISGTILHKGEMRSLVSQNGTVGHEIRTIQEFEYPWAPGSILVMNSDGLQSRWDLRNYPGLANHHPSVLSAVLWRDFTRGRDDVAVISLREKNSP